MTTLRKLDVLVWQGDENELYRPLLNSDFARFTYRTASVAIDEPLRSADVIFASTFFPAELLHMAHRLRWIHVAAAGVDRFVGGSYIPEGVILTRSDVSFGDSIAEYVIGHCLAHMQRLRDVFHLQQRRKWRPLEISLLKGRTMGIAGTGSVGRVVADRAGAMHMRVLGYAKTSRDIEKFERVYGPEQLLAFLAQLDILVLCLPLTSETHAFIGAQELSAMKPTALLINVARGAIMDEAALIDALRENRIEAAVLDVFEEEPLSENSPLWTMENVTVTAHHSGPNMPKEIAAYFLDNLERFATGLELKGIVDLKRGY